MGKLTFILGGTRSGKSVFAVNLAKASDKKVAFIATAQAIDEEMKKRISLHKEKRPRHWQIFEEPKDIPALIKKIGRLFDVILIDCLTIYISNLLLEGLDDIAIENHIGILLKTMNPINPDVIIVSNEVGLGIVPDNQIARSFRDLAGKINQIAAKYSDEVIFMASGLPIKLK